MHKPITAWYFFFRFWLIAFWAIAAMLWPTSLAFYFPGWTSVKEQLKDTSREINWQLPSELLVSSKTCEINMLWQIRASETLVTSANIRPLTKIKTHEQELLASGSLQAPTAKLFCKTIHTDCGNLITTFSLPCVTMQSNDSRFKASGVLRH